MGPRQRSRLRVVFTDTVRSFSLAANATLADVARALGELSRHHGNPIAVDVTLSQQRSAERQHPFVIGMTEGKQELRERLPE